MINALSAYLKTAGRVVWPSAAPSSPCTDTMGLGAAILSWFQCNVGTAHPEKDELLRARAICSTCHWLLGFNQVVAFAHIRAVILLL